MRGAIILSGLISASNSDILSGTRLQSFPRAGVLTIQVQAADADATNNMVLSLQLPGGETPLENVLVPGGNTAALAGVLDERTQMQASFGVQQGGHAVLSCTETGATTMTYRVIFTPA